ncbi:FAD/FMN-containing dehydrogenase [Crenobacter luteus]|uniref:FAD-binding oxidoreductase n=1 Tax=Crenobacter luteus TaxID=1452487 RepID=UPI001053E867|nr:FAD-binding oxidoreductase [Crenobacter luteus]TCP10923.1 FAD/FMN-containing dehydrogenase [Crenobacter luteus]
MSDLLPRLAAIVGDKYLLTSPTDTATYCLDWRKRYRGQPLAVARPGSTAEVSALVKLCRETGTPIVPQGGNTGLAGGATPDASGTALVIALGRMNKVREIDAANNSLTVEAGATLKSVQDAAAQAGRLFPLSLASEGTCQIGGNLSTNAGGLAVLRYGTMRDLALGLEVVLPDGRILDALSGLRKDTTGYDVKHWFIGAEGTLGLITAATLKLFPRPSAVATAFVGVASADEAIAWLGRLRERFSDRLTTFEIVADVCLKLVETHIGGARRPFVAPWSLLVELTDGGDEARLVDDLVEWLAEQAFVDAVVAQSESERQALWTLREAISEAQAKDGVSLKHDIALPSSAIPAFLRDADAALEAAFPGVRIVAFGHAGDGNLHYNLSYTRPGNANLYDDEEAANAIVYDAVARHGGTFAAEHGVGQLKTHWLARYKDPVALELMKTLKAALDPQQLMNPGKVLG